VKFGTVIRQRDFQIAAHRLLTIAIPSSSFSIC
jgi:hypothetical protein